MSENLRNYVKAIYAMDAVVQRVPEDQWDARTPCEEWSARELVAHQAGVFDAVAEMARSGRVKMPLMRDATGDIVATWNESRDRLLETLDRPGVIRRVGEYWFGEATLDELIAFATWDPLGHAWDLGQATGVDVPPLNEVAEVTLVVLEPLADGLRARNLIGEPVDVPADADAMTRFLGLAGRDPRGL